MKKWEYTVVPMAIGVKELGLSQEQILDKLGLEGWELVSVCVLTIKEGTEIIAYLKREKT